MKRFILLLILVQLSLVHYGQIIADHTVVDKFDQIPQHYLDSVKKMLVDVTGQSHSAGYSYGVNLLKALDTRFQASFYGWKNIVPDYTNLYLRIGSQYGAGEQHWFTTQDSINKMKQWITTQASTGNPFDVILFTWCYDMYSMRWNATLGNRDPVYDVRWYGSTENGPDGNNPFGLNSQDSDLTNNRINIDTYLDATEQYIQHCKANNFATKIIFTTGPVDNTGSPGNTEGTEKGLQREIKHQYIRDYVAQDPSRILFDFADILTHSNNGDKYVTYWNDNGNIRPHVNIHPDNMMDYDRSFNKIAYTEKGMHIGDVGALRLAKAMWWLLARIAGWDGSTSSSDTTPPTTPTFLSLTSASETSVTFSWSPSTDNVGVSGYRVYRSGNLLGTTTGLNYTDNTVTACINYTYTVSAFDAAGNVSAQSPSLVANTTIPAPQATITQPGCLIPTGTINITFPTGSGMEYSINAGANWVIGTSFTGLTAGTNYTIRTRNTLADAGCVSSSVFPIQPLPPAPAAPTVTTPLPLNHCPSGTIDLTQLITSSTPSGGSIYFKTVNAPTGANVPDPAAVGTGSLYIFYQNQDGCFSAGTEVVVNITSCPPDLAPTLLVNPNINHGVSNLNLIVKVAELNRVNTSGTITVHIPRDPRWYLTDGFVPSLTTLGAASLNNNVWSYSSSTDNHIFTSSSSIPEGGFSRFGFRVTFTPDRSRGVYTFTTRILEGGGEIRVDNNEDSEKIDYFE